MKEIIKAISECKKEFGKIKKDATNPFFNNQYLSNNALLDIVEPILEKHGLLLIQPIENNQVSSIIYHVETGENVVSAIPLPVITDPQKIGSAITYYRRYSLVSLLTLQSEDDDANLAAGNTKPKETKKPERTIEVWASTKNVNEILKLVTDGQVDRVEKGLKYWDTDNRGMSKANKELIKTAMLGKK